MSIKIIKVENDGFKDDEIKFLITIFIATISKLQLKHGESKAWLETFTLEELNIMLVVILKRINGRGYWEGKFFAKSNDLRIVAIDD